METPSPLMSSSSLFSLTLFSNAGMFRIEPNPVWELAGDPWGGGWSFGGFESRT